MNRALRLAGSWRVLLALAPVLFAIAAVDLAAQFAARPAGSGDTPIVSGNGRPPARFPSPDATVLWAVGDIADCGSAGDEATARLLGASEGPIALLGDLAYGSGTQQQFADCYGASWGGLADRVRPSPGNHEYQSTDAGPYFAYFGAAAGDPARGYYSYEIGAWHIIALNSNCDPVGGCDDSSAQLRWLTEDLAQSNASCTLAYWHHPLFSSGQHGDDGRMRQAYELLDAAGADVVLAGHDHDFERFAPQDANGQATVDGVRQFVVGTGGKSLRAFDEVRANSEVRFSGDFGALRLALEPSSYAWDFTTVAGRTVDSGTAECR